MDSQATGLNAQSTILPLAHPPGQLIQEPLLCPFTTGITIPNGLASSQTTEKEDSRSSTSEPAQPPLTTIQRDLTDLSERLSKPDTTIPESILESMPTFFHSGTPDKKVLFVSEHFDMFLTHDLYLKRLNDIHSMLWMCGRPLNARPLHKQMVDNRRIVRTEQADLHLLFYSDQMMIKPLPAYILCREVWEHHLCKDKVLHESACGLLLSYTWIIRSPLDFQIAQQSSTSLLPKDLTWSQWKRIVDESLKYIDPNALDLVNKRYHFGELRLQRVNSIYRTHPSLIFKHFIRGYLYGYNRYAPFLQRNVAWFFGVSVLFSLVLSAMQVGTGVSRLADNEAFATASFGFVVFSVIAVCVILAFIIVIFGFVFIYNMFAAIRHDKVANLHRKELAQEAWKKRMDANRSEKRS